jgi:hypothetical protein
MNHGPILTIRNTFSTHLHSLLFSASFYSENIKHINFLAHTTKTQKYHYRIKSTLLHCYLLYCTAYYILFYLHSHLVLDNHLVELGTQDEKIVLQVARRRSTRAFSTIPREFDINPEFPRGKNLLLLQHSALEVPTSWHVCLVPSGPTLIFCRGLAMAHGKQATFFAIA